MFSLFTAKIVEPLLKHQVSKCNIIMITLDYQHVKNYSMYQNQLLRPTIQQSHCIQLPQDNVSHCNDQSMRPPILLHPITSAWTVQERQCVTSQESSHHDHQFHCIQLPQCELYRTMCHIARISHWDHQSHCTQLPQCELYRIQIIIWEAASKKCTSIKQWIKRKMSKKKRLWCWLP